MALLVGTASACGLTPLADQGIDCDPMAYQYENEVWILTDGARARLSEKGIIAANPSLSPDRRKIAFTSGPEEDLDLFEIDIDGSNLTPVWAGETLQSSVDWSPDGKTLVFDQLDGYGILQIFTIPANGGQPFQLTFGNPNGKPKWTPDGNKILFLRVTETTEQEIYSMNPDGSNITNLTNDPARDVLAEMSPDSSRIVFASDRGGDFDIWVMDADGANPTRLTRAPERDTNPTWSSDGRHILFRSDREPAGLWAMMADGGTQAPILKNGWLADCP